MPKISNKNAVERKDSNLSQKLTTYNKKKFVPILKEINCNPNKEGRLIEKFKTINDTNVIKEYIDNQAANAQERIALVMHKERNEKFINLDNWAKYLCKSKPIHDSDNSITMILEMIAKTETLPPPSHLDGIDLSKMYMTLVNLMAGYPTEELNEPSKQFMQECFQELMQTVSNSTQNDSDLRQMKEIIDAQNYKVGGSRQRKGLGKHTENDDKINKLLNHSEINALQSSSGSRIRERAI